MLSQKPRKERRQRSLLTPAKSINTSNNKTSSASYYQHSAKHLYSHRVLLPSMVVRVSFLPAESSIRQVYSPTELSSSIGILATDRKSVV